MTGGASLTHVLRVLAVALAGLMAGCPENGAPGGEVHEPAPPGRPPNIIFVVMDTTRADHLSHSGWKHETTPSLDALVRDAVVYRKAHSTAPWTLPAHMSMFSGLLPGRHGATWAAFDSIPPLSLGHILKRRLQVEHPERMLPRRLKEAGYTTVGVSNNPWVSDRTGFGEGFDGLYSAWRSRALPPARGDPSPLELDLKQNLGGRGAGHSLEILNRHIRTHGLEEPFFVFFNFMDPHYPYVSPPGRTLRFGGDALVYRRMANPLTRIRELDLLTGAERIDFEELIPFYDACIFHMDRAIGRIVEWLRVHDWYESTLIVVTADHGEHLGEEGRASHQLSVEEELLWVPLIVKYPGNRGGGEIVDGSRVSTMDVYATILVAASGRSLSQAERGDSQNLERLGGSVRPYAMAEYYYSDSYLGVLRRKNPDFDPSLHQNVLRVVYTASHKFIYRGTQLSAVESLESSSSPAPTTPIRDQVSSWVQRYADSLNAPIPARRETAVDDAEFLQELRALGYVAEPEE